MDRNNKRNEFPLPFFPKHIQFVYNYGSDFGKSIVPLQIFDIPPYFRKIGSKFVTAKLTPEDVWSTTRSIK